MTRRFVVAVSVVLALAGATSARAQGKGAVVAPATAGVAPFAWIDDASVLPAGTIAISISALRWQGTDVNEAIAPVIGLAAGIAPRVQLGASVPRVVGDDISGVVGGLGTTYVSAKIGTLTGGPSGIKFAVAPTIEILGAGTLQSLTPDASRAQFGLPVSLEIDRGAARVFASAGFFSQGVWFAGGGIGAQPTPRVAVSAALSRAWTTDAIGAVVGDRREISGGVAFSPRVNLSLFGSLGRTIATTDHDGAGTTLTGGVMFLLPAPRPR